ncbi:prephenate dehydrogenase [Namhaeicola litoreus]|uniref:Prephenate dehydrogenase n=1 Tax=Namhaeicola litoreus TaxID=1052145 RepID=A0ABW3Y283_9FLAO
MKNVAVIGLGLMGGSLALELKKSTWATIYGIDKNPEHLQKAVDLGIIFEKVDIEKVKEVDTVILAAPVNVIPELALQVLDRIGDDTLVFDVGSTKTMVCDAVRNHPKRKNFVALHPIAGTEFSGPEAAIYDLFKGKVNIICEQQLSESRILEKAVKLFELLKMRNVFMDSPVQHDKHIAYVSHLSHISSFMLGKTVLEIENDEKNIFDMAGSGFASTVRLAKSNPNTWTPILLQNKEYVLKSLEEYIKNLNQFKEVLTKNSEEEVYQIMQNTNRIKGVLAGIKNN